MTASIEDIKRLAQMTLRDKGFYSGNIDGLWGSGSNNAYADYMLHLNERGQQIGEEGALDEDATIGPVKGVVVLDPGHGGTQKIGGSSPNNATSSSGVLEKNITLDMAKLIRKELNQLASQRLGSNLKVHLTRTSDENIGLADRARFAKAKKADVFLSIHCNGFDGSVRGTETLIISEQNGNINVKQDRALAERLQAAMFTTLKSHDPAATNRRVKDRQRLGVLKDVHLQSANANSKTRACLAELEFIDVPEVDALLNTGPKAKTVRKDLARSMAEAIIDDLEANS